MQNKVSTIIVLIFGLFVMGFASIHYYINMYSGETVKETIVVGQTIKMPKQNSFIYDIGLKKNDILSCKDGVLTGLSDGSVEFPLYSGFKKYTYHVDVYEVKEPDQSDQTLSVGDTVTLDEQENALDTEWRVSDQSLVKVEGNELTCLMPGDVVVSEIVNHTKTFNWKVKIEEPVLNFTEKEIKKDEEIRLLLSPCKGEVKWESSDPTIASIDETGKVTGLKKGETVINAKIGDFETSAKIKVESKDD